MTTYSEPNTALIHDEAVTAAESVINNMREKLISLETKYKYLLSAKTPEEILVAVTNFKYEVPSRLTYYLEQETFTNAKEFLKKEIGKSDE